MYTYIYIYMNIRIYIYIYTYEKANFTDVVAKHIYIISNSSTKLFHKSGLECDHASSEGLGAGHDNALRFLKPFFEVIHSLNPKWNLQIGISKMVLLPNVGMFGFHVEIRRCSWGWKGPKYLNTSKRIIYHMYIYIYPNIDPKNHIQKSGWSNPNSTRKLVQSPACGNQACQLGNVCVTKI